jgi:tape measure domain-containing protein
MATLQLKTNEQNFINGLKKASGSVGELAGVMNVKLANSFKSADFYSKNFEKGIGRLSSAFKEAGQGMTLGLTLPLAFLAKSASDAYGEFDALRRALGTMEKTSVGLTSRLKELREVAKMPGIGFQEAIQGDVRLRSVGISAALSAKILREFANAVAMTGGGKAQLNEITVQLGQMAAKGKVLAQDLRPIIEAAPAVATALKNMFGTVSSEAISEQLEKTGKSSTDMITMLLTEMEKAPRVTGGWKNSLENLGDTLFIAKAEIFEVADKVFDLSGKLASVTSTVEGFVEGFKNLPETTQKLVIGLVALAAILGPLAVGIGIVTSALTSLITVGALTIGTVTGIVGVIGLLGYAFMESTARANDMRKATESVESITSKATDSIAVETAKVMSLIDVIIDQKSSLEDVASAKKSLIALDPSFSASLKGEGVDFDNLELSVKKYVERLQDAAKIKELQARFDENEAKKAKLVVDPTGGNIFGDILPGSIGMGFRKELLEENVKLIKDYTAQSEEIAKEIARIDLKTIKQIESTSPPKTFSGNKGEKGSVDKPKYANKIEALKAVLKVEHDLLKQQQENDERAAKESQELADKTHQDKVRDMLTHAMEWAGIKLKTREESLADDVYKELGISTPDEIREAFNKRISAMMEGQAKEVERRKKQEVDAAEAAERARLNMVDNVSDFSEDMMAGIAESIIAGDSFDAILKQSLTALGNFAIQLGKQYYTIAKLKEIITKGSLSPQTALALIAGGVIVKGLASRMQVPKLAQGGMATNPTLAMIGDNKSGKEMVLPFERTGEFANMIASKMSGGGGEFIHTTRISGNDILILTERAKRAR